MLAFDTSALVSLSVGRVLPQALAIVKPVVTKTVLKELRSMASVKDELGMAAASALTQLSDIRVERVRREPTAEKELVLVVKRKRATTLVTDDLGAVRMAEASGVDAMFSVHVLYLLHQRGRVTRGEALAALERMRLGRVWKQNVIYQAAADLFGI